MRARTRRNRAQRHARAVEVNRLAVEYLANGRPVDWAVSLAVEVVAYRAELAAERTEAS